MLTTWRGVLSIFSFRRTQHVQDTRGVPILPTAQDLPIQLLQQIEQVMDNPEALSEVLCGSTNHHLKPKGNGRHYEHHLIITGEQLTVKVYNINLWLEPRHRLPENWDRYKTNLLVATVQSFLTPVILGRMRIWSYGLLKVWRGRQGFDDDLRVEKTYEGGVHINGSETHRPGFKPIRESPIGMLNPTVLLTTS